MHSDYHLKQELEPELEKTFYGTTSFREDREDSSSTLKAHIFLRFDFCPLFFDTPLQEMFLNRLEKNRQVMNKRFNGSQKKKFFFSSVELVGIVQFYQNSFLPMRSSLMSRFATNQSNHSVRTMYSASGIWQLLCKFSTKQYFAL